MSWNRVIQVTRGGRADPSHHPNNSRQPNQPPSYQPNDHRQHNHLQSDRSRPQLNPGLRLPNQPASFHLNYPQQYNSQHSNNPQYDRGRPQSDRGRLQTNQPLHINRPSHEPLADDQNDEAELEHRGILSIPPVHHAQITRTIAQNDSQSFQKARQGPSNKRLLVEKKAEHITNRLGPPVQEKALTSKDIALRLGRDKLDSPEIRKKRAERFNQSPIIAVGKKALSTGITDRGPVPDIHVKKRVKRLSDRKVVVLKKHTISSPNSKQPAYPACKGKAKVIGPTKTTSTYSAVRDQMKKSTPPALVPKTVPAARNPVKANSLKANPIKPNPVKPKIVPPAPTVLSPKAATKSIKPSTEAEAPSKVVSLKRAPDPVVESNKKLARAVKFGAPQSDSPKPASLADDFLSLDVPVEEKKLFKRTPITAPAKTDRASTEELIAINSDEDLSNLWDEVMIEPSSSKVIKVDKPVASEVPSTSQLGGGDIAHLKNTIVQRIDSGVAKRGADKLPNFDGLIDRIVEKILDDPEIKQSLQHKEPTLPTILTNPTISTKQTTSTKPTSPLTPARGGARPRKKALHKQLLQTSQTTKHISAPKQHAKKITGPKVVTTYNDLNRKRAIEDLQRQQQVRPLNPTEDKIRQKNTRPQIQNLRTGNIRNVDQRQVQQPSQSRSLPEEFLAKYTNEPKASSSKQSFQPPAREQSKDRNQPWQSCNSRDQPQERQALLPSPLKERLQRDAQHPARSRSPSRQEHHRQQQSNQSHGYQGNHQQLQTLLQQAVSAQQQLSTGRTPAQRQQYSTERPLVQQYNRGLQPENYSRPQETSILTAEASSFHGFQQAAAELPKYYCNQPLTQQQPSFGSSSNPANHSQMQVLQSQPSRYYTNHAETSLNNQYSGHMSKREQDSQYSGQQDRRAKKQSLHCKSCHAKFDNPALLQEHLQSDLHLMVNGDWWKTHRPPPKTITSQDVIWCVCCQKEFRFTSVKSLTDHMVDSVSHGKARNNWVKRFDAPPKYDWCLYSSLGRHY